MTSRRSRPGSRLKAVAVAAATLASLFAITPAQAEDRPVVTAVFGDSFAAGEGLPKVSSGEIECQRALGRGEREASKAWGITVLEKLKAPQKASWFAACTGASSRHFKTERQNTSGLLVTVNRDKTQYAEAVAGTKTERFDVLLSSFGGNDLGFDDIIIDCVGLDDAFAGGAVGGTFGGWAGAVAGGVAGGLTGRCRPGINDQLRNKINGHVKEQLKTLYDQFNATTTPGALIVVAGYPQVFEDPKTSWLLRNALAGRCHGMHEDDADLLRGIGGLLNQVIAGEVKAASEKYRDRTWVFADVSFPFQGHGLCSDRNDAEAGEWFNGFTLALIEGDFRPARSYHPNQDGHNKGYAEFIGRINKIEDWRPSGGLPVDASQLLNAPVPSLCKHPAGTLVKGRLPGIADNNGFVSVVLDERPPVIADLDGDGTQEIVAVLECSRGGVGWPNSLLLYGPGPRLLDEFKLADLTKELPDYEDDRSGAGRPVMREGRLHISWLAHRAGDTGAGPSLPVDLVLDVQSGKFTVVNVVRKDEASLLNTVVGAANKGDRGALQRLRLQPSTVNDLLQAVESRGRLTVKECSGTLDVHVRDWVRDSSLRSCLLQHATGAKAYAYLSYDYKSTWELDAFHSPTA